MKKVTKAVLFLFVASLSLSSCNKDDDNNAVSTSGNIVGKWEYSKEGTIVAGKEYLTDYEHEAGCSKDYVEFKADGTSIDGEYDEDCTLDTYSSTYVKSGNTITVEDGQSVQILQLDASTLKTKTVYDDSDTGNSITEIYVFKRTN